MKKIYLLFSCDAWHTYTSKGLLGVFENRHFLITALEKHLKQNKLDEIDQDDKYNLSHINQTQNRADNYTIESQELNKIMS